MQRAIDKTDDMQARAAAVDELQAAGTFEDLTSLGPPQDDIDRQLDQLGAKSAVDDEFAKLKAELGSGQQSALPAGEPPAAAQPTAAPEATAASEPTAAPEPTAPDA